MLDTRNQIRYEIRMSTSILSKVRKMLSEIVFTTIISTSRCVFKDTVETHVLSSAHIKWYSTLQELAEFQLYTAFVCYTVREMSCILSYRWFTTQHFKFVACIWLPILLMGHGIFMLTIWDQNPPPAIKHTHTHTYTHAHCNSAKRCQMHREISALIVSSEDTTDTNKFVRTRREATHMPTHSQHQPYGVGLITNRHAASTERATDSSNMGINDHNVHSTAHCFSIRNKEMDSNVHIEVKFLFHLRQNFKSWTTRLTSECQLHNAFWARLIVAHA